MLTNLEFLCFYIILVIKKSLNYTLQCIIKKSIYLASVEIVRKLKIVKLTEGMEVVFVFTCAPLLTIKYVTI